MSITAALGRPVSVRPCGEVLLCVESIAAARELVPSLLAAMRAAGIPATDAACIEGAGGGADLTVPFRAPPSARAQTPDTDADASPHRITS
jgi:hypothetical protein